MKLKVFLLGLLVQLAWDALFLYVLLEPSIDMFGLPEATENRSFLLKQFGNLVFAPIVETIMTAQWFNILLKVAVKRNKDLAQSLPLKVFLAVFIGVAWGLVHPGAIKVSATGGFILLMLGYLYHIKDEPFSRQKNISGCIYMAILHFIHNFIF